MEGFADRPRGLHVLVTCHTEGCQNEGIVIPIEQLRGDMYCGPCDNPIQDIVLDSAFPDAYLDPIAPQSTA